MLSRRRLFACAPIAMAMIAGRRAIAAPSDRTLAAAAHAGLERHRSHIRHDDVLGVVDFSRHSRDARFHLVDRLAGRITSLRVAHGRGSDPAHTGFAERFSNLPGSYASSEGAYVTGAGYVGQHGASMRLHGLENSNSNAEARAIVVHAAWYVEDDVVRSQGKAGRSEGCFAVRQADLEQVLQRLGEGRLLLALRS